MLETCHYIAELDIGPGRTTIFAVSPHVLRDRRPDLEIAVSETRDNDDNRRVNCAKPQTFLANASSFEDKGVELKI